MEKIEQLELDKLILVEVGKDLHCIEKELLDLTEHFR